MAVGDFRVRPARSAEELQEFEKWATMAEAGGPTLAEELLQAHTAGNLSTALRDAHRSYEALLAGVMQNDFEAVAWSRTMALVATLKGEVVGGLLAGPSAQFLYDMAEKHDLGVVPVLDALLHTSKLHLVAVDDSQRRRGAGEALISTAVSTAYLSGAQILYGQFLTKNPGLAYFYGRQGFTLMPPETPLNFSAWMGGLSAGPAPLPGERFFYRDLSDAAFRMLG
ncbi:GNAT family N-acetyltransferase [Nocardia carnea]|uniref:GNAT family N-acetyltransferase n=1 Tax=Nocardia carnea TaxID=37328 RepID=UPI0024551D90|nr:GNAT family N-acetyltransferase [Nocardia carnea]